MSNFTATLEPPTDRAEILAGHSFTEPASPAWLEEVRRQGLESYARIPLPTRKDEAWRFSNLAALETSNFVPALPVAESLEGTFIERSKGLDRSAGRMIFANGQLLSRQTLESELEAKGVVFLSLEQAAESHPELLRKYFMQREIRLGSAKFAALHQAHAGAGTVIQIPRNVELTLPLEIFHWLEGDNAALFPHTLIVAGENSRVTVLEHFASAADTSGLACSVNDLVLGPGAKLTYVAVQDWSEKTTSFQINTTEVDRDASAVHLGLHLGSKYARYESLSRLHGAGGRSDMLALTVGHGKQEFDQRTFQDHSAPHCTSDLLYKNALFDSARSIFAGLIKVEEHSHKTDAYQKVRNLLLSDDAEADSMPGLEILADDVRCSHGATSGQLDAEELFYLLSRGIPQNTSRQMLVAGFLNEVLARLGQPEIEALLGERIAAKFSRMAL